MDAKELEKNIDGLMVCKDCGAVFKYTEVVAMLDSSELPGNMVCMSACKNCGGFNYELRISKESP